MVDARLVDPTHTARPLQSPNGWIFYLAHASPRRLVVFVHGFWGRPVDTWECFPDGALDREWWAESDFLFVNYQSDKDTIAGAAARLRESLPDFYPRVEDSLVEVGGVIPRESFEDPYEELFIAGHSLGGAIVRRALCDIAAQWTEELAVDPEAPRPSLLEAKTRLFSPASKGFQPSGRLGLLSQTPFWDFAKMFLTRSPAFTELAPGSDVLVSTERRTLNLLSGTNGKQLEALRARILWAQPDNVVMTERYDTDPVEEFAEDSTHRSVCKPNIDYQRPWDFMEKP